MSLGLTRGSVVVVMGTESVGEGRTDSGIGASCVVYCSVLLLFGVGSFCFFCGTVEPFASFSVAIVMPSFVPQVSIPVLV